MDAHKAKIPDIVNNSTLIEVPFFQRAYVWKEDLWERFLDDMAFVVQYNRPHFLGKTLLFLSKTPLMQQDLFLLMVNNVLRHF